MKVFDDKEYLTIFIPAQKANFRRQNLHDFNIVGGRFVDFNKKKGLPNLCFSKLVTWTIFVL